MADNTRATKEFPFADYASPNSPVHPLVQQIVSFDQDPTASSIKSILTSLPKFAVFGDSIQAFNSSAGPLKEARGSLTWLQFQLKQRITFEAAGNFGVAGDTTTLMRARVQNVIDYKPDICLVAIGTNDIDLLVPFNTITLNLAFTLNKLLNSGIIVILQTILPRSLNMTTGKALLRARVNNYIEQQARISSKLIVINPNVYMEDQTSVIGAPLSNMLIDELHPNMNGGYWSSVPLLSAVDNLIPIHTRQFADPADVYDTVNNPYGNMITNGCMTGSGAIAGSGVSGTQPTGWTLTRFGSSTGAATGTAQARADGLPGFEFVFSVNLATQTAAEEWIFAAVVNQSGTSYTPGMTLVAGMEMEMTGATNMLACYLSVAETDGTTGIAITDLNPLAASTMPTVSLKGAVRTLPFVARPYSGSGTASITVRGRFKFDATVSATATITVRAGYLKQYFIGD